MVLFCSPLSEVLLGFEVVVGNLGTQILESYEPGYQQLLRTVGLQVQHHRNYQRNGFRV